RGREWPNQWMSRARWYLSARPGNQVRDLPGVGFLRRIGGLTAATEHFPRNLGDLSLGLTGLWCETVQQLIGVCQQFLLGGPDEALCLSRGQALSMATSSRSSLSSASLARCSARVSFSVAFSISDFLASSISRTICSYCSSSFTRLRRFFASALALEILARARSLSKGSSGEFSSPCPCASVAASKLFSAISASALLAGAASLKAAAVSPDTISSKG